MEKKKKEKVRVSVYKAMESKEERSKRRGLLTGLETLCSIVVAVCSYINGVHPNLVMEHVNGFLSYQTHTNQMPFTNVVLSSVCPLLPPHISVSPCLREFLP